MIQTLSSLDFLNMENRYRARLINSLSGFKSINLVGTQNKNGQTNLAIVSSVIHIGSNPALMGFVMRPITVTRDTYNNILETNSYTLNHISESIYKQAHQTSARYPANISEFDEVGLTAEYTSLLSAPYVSESIIKLGMKFKEKLDIKSNGTILMIGEIIELIFPKSCLASDGVLDIEMAGSITSSGLDSYHLTKKIARLSYAKPGKELEEL